MDLTPAAYPSFRTQSNPRDSKVLATGRSSGSSILILPRLPRLTPSGRYIVPETELLSYSDGFAQVFHLLPFSPDQNGLTPPCPTPAATLFNLPKALYHRINKITTLNFPLSSAAIPPSTSEPPQAQGPPPPHASRPLCSIPHANRYGGEA